MPSRRPDGRAGGGEAVALGFLGFRNLAVDRGEDTRAGGVPEAFCTACSATGAGGEGRGAGPPATPLMDGVFSTREKSKAPVSETLVMKDLFP